MEKVINYVNNFSRYNQAQKYNYLLFSTEVPLGSLAGKALAMKDKKYLMYYKELLQTLDPDHAVEEEVSIMDDSFEKYGWCSETANLLFTNGFAWFYDNYEYYVINYPLETYLKSSKNQDAFSRQFISSLYLLTEYYRDLKKALEYLEHASFDYKEFIPDRNHLDKMDSVIINLENISSKDQLSKILDEMFS